MATSIAEIIAREVFRAVYFGYNHDIDGSGRWERAFQRDRALWMEAATAALVQIAPFIHSRFYKLEECMRLQNEAEAERDRALKALAKAQSINERLRLAMRNNEKTSIRLVDGVLDERDRLHEALLEIVNRCDTSGPTGADRGAVWAVSVARAALATTKEPGT